MYKPNNGTLIIESIVMLDADSIYINSESNKKTQVGKSKLKKGVLHEIILKQEWYEMPHDLFKQCALCNYEVNRSTTVCITHFW